MFGESLEKSRVVFLEVEKSTGFEVLKSIVDLLCKTFLDEKLINESDLRVIKYN